MSPLRRALLIVASGLALSVAAIPNGHAYEGGIKLFPLLYRSQSGNDVEALGGLYGSHTRGADYDRRVLPVFWGSGGNWVLLPCAWSWDPDGYEFESQPLLDVAGGKVGHFSLLWRLFEYHRDPQESYWLCLFLPLKFGRRAAAATP